MPMPVRVTVTGWLAEAGPTMKKALAAPVTSGANETFSVAEPPGLSVADEGEPRLKRSGSEPCRSESAMPCASGLLLVMVSETGCE